MNKEPFGEGTPFPTAAELWRALNFIDRHGLSKTITTDWRESRAIAEMQAEAAAEALIYRMEDLDIAWRQARNEAMAAQSGTPPGGVRAAGDAAWKREATRIIADAIHARNVGAKAEIEAALDGMREWALNDDELKELMK